MNGLRISRALLIPAAELSESYSRSPGPGGQNVNKVATRVELRWNLRNSAALAESDRSLLLERLGRRLTTSGDLVVSSSLTRHQSRNRVDVRLRLAELVRAALRRPRRRLATQPSRTSVERRLAGKKRRGELKRVRARKPKDD